MLNVLRALGRHFFTIETFIIVEITFLFCNLSALPASRDTLFSRFVYSSDGAAERRLDILSCNTNRSLAVTTIFTTVTLACATGAATLTYFGAGATQGWGAAHGWGACTTGAACTTGEACTAGATQGCAIWGASNSFSFSYDRNRLPGWHVMLREVTFPRRVRPKLLGRRKRDRASLRSPHDVDQSAIVFWETSGYHRSRGYCEEWERLT